MRSPREFATGSRLPEFCLDASVAIPTSPPYCHPPNFHHIPTLHPTLHNLDCGQSRLLADLQLTLLHLPTPQTLNMARLQATNEPLAAADTQDEKAQLKSRRSLRKRKTVEYTEPAAGDSEWFETPKKKQKHPDMDLGADEEDDDGVKDETMESLAGVSESKYVNLCLPHLRGFHRIKIY